MPVNCGSSQEPSARWLPASQRTPRSTASGVTLARRQQRHERPGGLRGGGGAAGDPAAVAVGAQVLTPAAVLVLHRLQPGDGAPDRRVGDGQPGGGEGGHDRARAVDVVDAPAAEPRAAGLLLREEPVDAAEGARVAARPSWASISTTWAVTSADGGSTTSPKSQNGSLFGRVLVLSASKAPQAPVAGLHADGPAHGPGEGGLHPRRVGVPHPAQREDDLGGVVDVGVGVVVELERPAARRRCGRRTAQSPGRTICSASSQSAARTSAGWSGAVRRRRAR